MTIKAQSDFHCPQCGLHWLPYEAGLKCPQCARETPEQTAILDEALESARFNARLYGRFDVDYWTERLLGDRYLKWGFKALELARADPNSTPAQAAIMALLDLDLEELAPYRAHVAGFLERLIERYRAAATVAPAEWAKMPEPEKPFFGRKIIED